MTNVKNDRKVDWKRLVKVIFAIIFLIASVFLRLEIFDEYHGNKSNQNGGKTNVEMVLTMSDVGQADNFYCKFCDGLN